MKLLYFSLLMSWNIAKYSTAMFWNIFKFYCNNIIKLIKKLFILRKNDLPVKNIPRQSS